MLRTPVGRLRVIGFIEGMSYLFLLFIAMPLKYWANIPVAVSVTGMLHGVFFVLFLFALAHVFFAHRKSFWFGLGGVIASFIPFGTFVLDRKLKKMN
ncbi:DUF3817 domain-containing protein [Bacillus sp. BGMRC 2118]|nr:DUF3817 domain-containing protein [Bacillus sp. BGMRC 2118]